MDQTDIAMIPVFRFENGLDEMEEEKTHLWRMITEKECHSLLFVESEHRNEVLPLLLKIK